MDPTFLDRGTFLRNGPFALDPTATPGSFALRNLEEIVVAEMIVALRVSRIDTRRFDLDLDRALRGRCFVERDLAGELFEGACDLFKLAGAGWFVLYRETRSSIS